MDPSAAHIERARSGDELARRDVFMWAYENALHYFRYERKKSRALHWLRSEGFAIDMALRFIERLPDLDPDTACNWYSKTLKWAAVRRSQKAKWKRNHIERSTFREQDILPLIWTGRLRHESVSDEPDVRGLSDDDLNRLRAIRRAYDAAAPAERLAFDFMNADPPPPYEDVEEILGITTQALGMRLSRFRDRARTIYAEAA